MNSNSDSFAGHAGAYSQLGTIYARGHGVKEDNETANAYWRRGAELGDVEAMHNLGVSLQIGRGGVPQDNATAFKWFFKSHEAGMCGWHRGARPVGEPGIPSV